MKKLIILMSLVVLGIFITISASADTRNTGAEFLVETAERFYHQGRMEDAIHEFSKALMLEPDNKKALKYLKDLHIDGGLYGKRPLTNLSRVAQFAQDSKRVYEQLDEYQEKIENLKKERLTLQNMFDQLYVQKESLDQMNTHQESEIESLRNQVNRLMEKELQFQEKISQAEKFYIERNKELEERLSKRKEIAAKSVPAYDTNYDQSRLKEQLKTLEDQYDQLKVDSQKRELDLGSTITNLKLDLSHKEKEIAVLNNKLNIKDHQINKEDASAPTSTAIDQKTEMDKLNQELIETELQLAKAQSELAIKLKELSKLTQKMHEGEKQQKVIVPLSKPTVKDAQSVDSELLLMQSELADQKQVFESVEKELEEANGQTNRLITNEQKFLNEMKSDIYMMKK